MRRIAIVLGLLACDSTPAAPPGGTGRAEVVEDTSVVETVADGFVPDLIAETVALPDTDLPEDTDGPEDTAVADIAVADTGADSAPEAVEDAAGPVLIACATDDDCDPGLLCIDDACVCDTTPVSFADEVLPLFKGTCGTSCHVVNSATGGSAGLNLNGAFAHGELVGKDASQCSGANADRLRVVAGDVGRSYLMDKILGRRMCRGTRMPKNRAAWTEAQKATLGRWICQGAPAN